MIAEQFSERFQWRAHGALPALSKSRLFDFHLVLSRIGAKCGLIAQLGERMTGSHEVVGSIPIGSTIFSSQMIFDNQSKSKFSNIYAA